MLHNIVFKLGSSGIHCWAMRWYHATRIFDRKSNSRSYTQSFSFLDRLLGGEDYLCVWGFFLHLDHFLIYYVLPNLVLKTSIVCTCSLMAFIPQLQCSKSTNSGECFDQIQRSLHTLQSILVWLSSYHDPHPNLTLQSPDVEASGTEHLLFFFYQMINILLCSSTLPETILNPLTTLHLIYYNLT